MPYSTVSGEAMRELEPRARIVLDAPPPPHHIPESTHELLSQMQTLHKMRCKETEDVANSARLMNARYESLIAESEALLAAIERIVDWQRRSAQVPDSRA